ncbi:MAG: type II toxin-antitoxin system RelE/ParE family toxin [Deltaproteobacteria bacterium]|nr:type II toxin-antitoxin system RelE/ParE family toxin [Deltaproteobacteria bacterium]
MKEKDIKFHGSSLDDLKSFPPGAMKAGGQQLRKVQRGLDPSDWKPMGTVGSGVMEIRIWWEGDTFRVFYVAKFSDAVHVLHCFQKTTQNTSQRDIKIGKARYKQIGG